MYAMISGGIEHFIKLFKLKISRSELRKNCSSGLYNIFHNLFLFCYKFVIIEVHRIICRMSFQFMKLEFRFVCRVSLVDDYLNWWCHHLWTIWIDDVIINGLSELMMPFLFLNLKCWSSFPSLKHLYLNYWECHSTIWIENVKFSKF